jgi:hypothetical protein
MHDLQVWVGTAGLYGTPDTDLAVFLLERLRKHCYSRSTIKRFMLIRAVWIREEGALMVHEKVARFSEIVKGKLLVNEGQG